MGCGESKIKRISLSPDPNDTDIDTISGSLTNGRLSAKSNLVQSPTNENTADDSMLPNRLLAAIPVSDLGDSLDSRHLSESLNLNHSFKTIAHGNVNGNHFGNHGSADSHDSADSGYDEYEEEYSHVITEASATNLVQQVNNDFKAVDLPELLVITGRACARILSGYQKTRQNETRILDALREEGLLAKPKVKTAGGMSFEVVDANVIEEHQNNNEKGDAFVSSNFIPRKKLEKLERRRVNIRKPSAKLDQRLAEAEERRLAAKEEKVKKVIEHTGLERHGRMRSASALRRENNYSATLAKRQQQLQDMRDRLKEKNKKADLLRLKHQLVNGNSGGHVENGLTGTLVGGAGGGGGAGGKGQSFFDD